MQNQEEPISITEDANGFHLNGDTTEEQEEPSSVTWIENDDDANKYQEKIKKEHTSVEEECQRLQDSMEDVDVDSTGETEADVMVNMLLNQKPGGPKIFYSRDNV
jgi:predicted transcriptional regulator